MDLPASLLLTNLSCGAGHRTLFEGLDLDLRAGQWAVLRGHNGSGKSTLLRCVAGLSRALSGSIKLHGGVLYQSHYSGWKESFTATENLAWQAQIEGDAQPKYIASTLERVGVKDQADLKFARLSAGQKRRVSLARLLLSPSPIWLLDEPTTALDQQGQALFAEILVEHIARGGVALIATHLAIPDLAPHFVVDLGEA
jgi:heme exporter protein A